MTTLDVGDTLIVYSGKFVHIPSGDDVTTSITVTGYDSSNNSTTPLGNFIGPVSFNFNDTFVTTKNGTNGVNIGIQEATEN
jgi:hypothetical protein